jgi:2-dehydrotetronate isomerase
MLFTGHPLMDRFRLAKDAGFDAVEVPFPYDCPVQEMRDQLVWNAQTFVAMNAPPPNATGGPRGFAAIPGGEHRFRHDFDRALRFAGVLKPRHIHLETGEAHGAEARRTLIANLTWAAVRAPGQSITIGPLVPEDLCGHVLNDYALTAEVLTGTAAPNIGLQFDTGLAARMHGELPAVWDRFGPQVRHVRIRPTPGWTGAVPFDLAAFLRRLDTEGYEGFVSVAHIPRHGEAARD